MRLAHAGEPKYLLGSMFERALHLQSEAASTSEHSGTFGDAISLTHYTGYQVLHIPASLIHQNLPVAVALVRWYNLRRPHSSLEGASPDEIYLGKNAPKNRPRIEVRSRYPIIPSDIGSGQVR